MIDCKKKPRRAGFSLLELTLSLGILALFMTAIGAAIVLSARTLPTENDVAGGSRTITEVLDTITADLAYATSVSEASANAVSFTVDRSGVLNSLRYEWSGTPGDPLTRTLNGSTVNLIDEVESFNLEYVTRQLTGDQPPSNEGAEELVLLHDESTGDGTNFNIESNLRIAEVFPVNFPANTASWRVTRVSYIAFPAQQANGALSVSVRSTGGNGKPSNQVIDEVIEQESSFVNNTWHESVFPNAAGLDPNSEYAIVFERAGGGGTVARIKTAINSFDSPETRYYLDLGGGTFEEQPNTDIRIKVWGQPTFDSPAQPPTSGLTLSARVSLERTSHPGMIRSTSIALLNRPQFPTQ